MTQIPDTLFTYVQQPCDPATFVNYWRQQYKYPDMRLYHEGITGDVMTKDRLRNLFTWKNGMILSEKKNRALEEKIVSKLPVVRILQEQFDQDLFEEHFGKLTVVWKIFLLHIIDPQEYPIFDQHVYRAYRYLNDPSTVNMKDPKVTMDAYKAYRIYYQKMCTQYSKIRTKNVDDALWGFGKFLARYPQMV